MKILAIIPARGGSKRLPRKNILELCGKPLIQWTIDAVLGCDEIDTVMVSTDCYEIAKIAKNSGAEVPFLRNAELSSDTASSADVVMDVISYYSLQDKEFDAILLLQPTSPLRTKDDIFNAIKLYKNKLATSVVSVTECDHSPLWCNILTDDLNMDSFIDADIKKLRSQDLPIYYRINGAIYLVDIKDFCTNKSFMPKGTYSLIMSRENSIDIDNKLDFQYAELILKNNNDE